MQRSGAANIGGRLDIVSSDWIGGPISPEEVDRLGIERGTSAYRKGLMYLMVSPPGWIGGLRHGWHMSISHSERYPTWDEVSEARYRFVPDEVTMVMHLPPRGEYVNIHPNCFQLHEEGKR